MRIIIVGLCICALLILGCQKNTFELGKTKKSDSLPEYSVELDVNKTAGK